MSRSAIPRSLRDEVFTRDAGRCCFCGVAQVGQSATFHIDHVLPRAKGGVAELSNLVLQCPWCSLHKSDKTEEVDDVTGGATPLFHPLRQAWGDHFEWCLDGTIAGRTPVGRATVGALHMNDPIPRHARRGAILLGLLPPD